MSDGTFQLTDLAEETGIEPRTIRSYIERGLLPGAQNLGRGATYTLEHLDRLRVIQSLRRARPSILLNEIVVLFQHVTPQQISGMASGSLTATAPVVEEAIEDDQDPDRTQRVAESEDATDPNANASARQSSSAKISTSSSSSSSFAQMAPTERLVIALQKLSGYSRNNEASNVETWNRISVTSDIELSVRGEVGSDRLKTFAELADLLRQLLQNTDGHSKKGDE